MNGNNPTDPEGQKEVQQIKTVEHSVVGRLDMSVEVLQGRLDMAEYADEPKEIEYDEIPPHTVTIQLTDGTVQLTGLKMYLQKDDKVLLYTGDKKSRHMTLKDDEGETIDEGYEDYVMNGLGEALTKEQKDALDLKFSKYNSHVRSVEAIVKGSPLIDKALEKYSEVDGVGEVTMQDTSVNGSTIWEVLDDELNADYKTVSTKKDRKLRIILQDVAKDYIKSGQARHSKVLEHTSGMDDFKMKEIRLQHKVERPVKELLIEQIKDSIDEDFYDEPEILGFFKKRPGKFSVVTDENGRKAERLENFSTDVHTDYKNGEADVLIEAELK